MRRAAVFAAVTLTIAPAGATPLRCADPCTIVASTLLYRLPVTEIAPGTTVLFTSTDTAHPTTDAPGPQSCFLLSVAPAASSAVRFDIDGPSLVATADGATMPCGNAIALPGTGFALPYRCILHPNMVAAFLVTSL